MLQSQLEYIDESHIKYNGVVWTRYPESNRRQLRVYYWHHSSWKKSPEALHRQLYKDFVGPIPAGYHIHHKDSNPENNSITNLECMPGKQHAGYFWNDPENKETQEEFRRKRRGQYNQPEFRKKMSEAQKNRSEVERTCKLCEQKFMTKSRNAKWCRDCYSHQTSNKGHRYFPVSWQIAKFGKIKIDPSIDLSMLK